MGCASSNGTQTENETRQPSPKRSEPEPPDKQADDTADESDNPFPVLFEREQSDSEVEISSTVEGYPIPEPQNVIALRRPVQWWYEGISDVTSTSGIKVNLSTRNSPRRNFVDFREIDEHARQATVTQGDSFQALTSYIEQGISTDRNKKLLTARALIVWLSQQNVTSRESAGTGDQNSPNGIIQMLRCDRIGYTKAYTILCRAAGIPCVIVWGVGKCGDYEPGDEDIQDYRISWTAIHDDFSWHLIHPFWICRARAGRQIGGWVKLESDGKAVRERQIESQGYVVSRFNDYYFMVRPEEFIYRCYPDDNQWQLLINHKEISYLKDFARLPYFLPPYFSLDVELVSERSSFLLTSEGKCLIEFKADMSMMNKLNLTYDLYQKETADTNIDTTQSPPGKLVRLVLNERRSNKFSFEVRCQTTGTYRLIIYGAPNGSTLLRCCQFRIDCKQLSKEHKLLPIDVGIEGWGPGPVAEGAGLILPSKLAGKIPVKAGRGKNKVQKRAFIKFHLKDEVVDSDEFDALMYSSDFVGEVEHEQLQENVQYKVDKKSKTFHVSAIVPKKGGEYAVSIRRAEKNSSQNAEKDYKRICNYLLTTLVTVRETVPQRKAREAVSAAMKANNVDDLEAALKKCEKAKIPDDDDDIAAARDVLEFLQLKRDLRECSLRRNRDVNRKILTRVENYKNKDGLRREVERVKDLNEELRQLGIFTQDVPKLKQAADELAHVSQPMEEIHDTMIAFFLLFGESEDCLQFWDYILVLLGSSDIGGRRVFDKIAKLEEEERIKSARRNRAEAILFKHDEERVRHVSQAAASFYRWTKGVLKVYNDTED